MTELAIALLVGGFIVSTGRSLVGRDRLVAARVAALTGDVTDGGVGRTRLGLLRRATRSLPGDREGAKRALKNSGVLNVSPDTFVGSRYLSAAVVGIMSMQLGAAAIVIAPLAILGGYRLPDIYLKARRKARTDQLRSELPDVIDLLCVCVQAGLNISLSLKRVSSASTGVLGDELRRVVSQIDLGVPRRNALEELADRHQLDDLDALVTTLINAERFGTGVSSGLQVLSSDLRAKRRRSAEEEARRAPVKILFPLVFLILPAFILLTVVPLLLGTFQGLGF